MSFTMRTSKPSGNKFYITKDCGGYSKCIKGKPLDSKANVLSNCVGYSCGRFNEIIGTMKYPTLNCNAENFIERAKSLGLKISSVPTLGGIMVWQKGATLSNSDGAGHVEVVEAIYDNNNIYTSASNYGGTAFYNAKRSNSNGRWGMASGYKFRGCIVNPSVKEIVGITSSIDLSKYTDVQLACLVWKDKFGSGDTRKKALGARYKNVQALVQKGVGKSKTSVATNNALAQEVLKDLWGKNPSRKNKLKENGFDYNAVQKIVNKLI